MTNSEIRLDVFDIERFAVHDGPGIRTTVFLQGCPLRCPWCANPESWQRRVQVLHFGNKCVGCGACVAACPRGGVELDAASGQPVFDRAECRGCGQCAKACLAGAIQLSGQRMRVGEVTEELARDSEYYAASGGGITISGGEPLVQFAGTLALLHTCKAKGWHTAVETTGHAPRERFATVAATADLLLFDCKHHNKVLLQEATGADLDLLLENLRGAVEVCEVIARIPVIPGFNDSMADMTAMLAMLAGAGVRQAHLLPYHNLGVAKYQRLGLCYPMGDAPALQKEALEQYLPLGENIGIGLAVP